MARATRPGARSAGARLAAARGDAGRRRRALSQNYLRSPEAARLFLRAVRLDPDGICVEVGAGEGILTTRLATRSRQVIAYEIDQNLAERLRDRVRGHDNVKLIIGDFLTARPPPTAFQVVGNAPFSLTTPIVEWCLRSPRLTAATLITQLEYARKRTGGFGRWSLVTVTSWPQFRWELRGKIPRTEFKPVPRVDAGILHLERRPEPLISPARLGAYRRMVQTGFSGVGGSVQASLRRTYPADRVSEACATAGVERRAIVAFVTPDQWVQIFLSLDSRA